MAVNVRTKAVLLFLLLSLPLFVRAQQLSSPGITLEVKEKPLQEVLQQLEAQSTIQFSYSPKRIPASQPVSLKASNEPLESVLARLLDPLEVEYMLVGEKWVLTPKPKPKTDQQKTYTLSGYLRDSASGETLIGALVMVPALERGVVSNAYGFYSLSLPEGQHKVRVSYVGYGNQEYAVSLHKDQHLNVQLKEAVAMLQEVKVSAQTNLSEVALAELSRRSLPAEEVQDMPALFGEEEVLKAVQLLPGIQAHNDGSAQFHVRGGARDQNYILLDDAPIYNPAHTLGIFTTIVPETVKDIRVYKGDMPARFGGRLSSVVDVRTRDGNMQKFGATASLGLATSQFLIEGPIARDKASYLLSLRNAHIKGYLQAFRPELSDYGFYDLNLKLNYRASDRNRYYLSFYSGEDTYEENARSGLRWGNNALSLRWNRLLGKKLFLNTTFYASSYDFYLTPKLEREHTHWHAGISNGSLKMDFSWFANARHQLDFGLEFQGHEFAPGNIERNGELAGDSTRIIGKRFARGAVLYVSDVFQPTERLKLEAGLRLNSWKNLGESTEYVYNEVYRPVDSVYHASGQVYHSEMLPEPRLAISLQLDSLSSLSLNYAHTVQTIHQVSNTISPFTNLEVWLPSGPNIAPQRANLLALGYFRRWPEKGIQFSTEVYIKHMKNLLGYAPHAHLLLNPFLEGELRQGTGKAWGWENRIEKRAENWYGWLGYTYSRTQLQFPELNEGEVYPAAYDRPHQLEAFMAYEISPRVELSGSMLWASGKPFTAPVGFYTYQHKQVPVYGSLHNDRLPAYHRMDAAVTFDLSKKGGKLNHQLKASVYNLYMRKNPIYLNFNKVISEEGELLVPADTESGNALTATHTYLFRFVPSLTYQLSL